MKIKREFMRTRWSEVLKDTAAELRNKVNNERLKKTCERLLNDAMKWVNEGGIFWGSGFLEKAMCDSLLMYVAICALERTEEVFCCSAVKFTTYLYYFRENRRQHLKEVPHLDFYQHLTLISRKV